MKLSIEGRVQGVGFRHFTVTTARKLNSVTGWVKNERNGSVTVVAEGSEDDLRQLRSAVEEGPRRAKVDSVKETYEEPTGQFSAFEVKY